ncbi:unnamed protein product [Brassicogethes aeneus]|uniref:Uncharacterized protein n=1 Tax=Brassicogethes aeneus TaxID=1431903 RepID=A0A9P0FP06_BRAAE|nr:unnamed protein product [Brassicogethes aeneus]
MVELKKLRFKNYPNPNSELNLNPDELQVVNREEEEISTPETFDYQENLDDSESDYDDIFLDTDPTKLNESLLQITQTLREFVLRRGNLNMPEVNLENLSDIPPDLRVVAYLLSQGDNRRVEDLLRTVHQNVVVNVNLSYYFKIMLIMLTFNSLLLFKLIVWDQMPF